MTESAVLIMDFTFSDRCKDMKPSAIRELFKVIPSEGAITFSAGNPSPLSFPVEEFAEIAADIFKNDATAALQYSVTEGNPKLIEQIKKRLKERFYVGADYDETIITTGGQQAIDLTAKALCNEGDVVICENPSFIGALNAFRAYNLKLVGVDMEDDGISVEKLEKALKENPNAKIIYLIPTFQNPTGITMPLKKRKAVLELAQKYNVFILEDDPYVELRFTGVPEPEIKSLDTDGHVIYCGSFSKILSPGMRLGYLCAHKEIINKVTVLKQVADSHTNIFSQMLASRFMEKYDLDAHIKKIKDLYRSRCSLMLYCINQCFPDCVKHTIPEGGMFIWATLPEGYDSRVIAKKALERKIAIVSGATFLPEQNQVSNAFRMNFSTPSDEDIVEGIKRLGDMLKEELVK